MLIAEIILTIIAWNRGWRWYSLLPVGIAVAIGLLIGFVIGLDGGSPEDAEWVITFDILAILVLLYMCFTKREFPKTENSDEQFSEKK